jgi:cytochrome P450
MPTPARHHKLPPGPPASFLLGHTIPYLRNEIGYLTKAVREYGDLVRLRLGNLPTYVVVNPAHIDYVLKTQPDNFEKDVMTRWLIPLVGQGLLTSEGEFWRRQRRLIRPAFQLQEIQHYASVMVEHTERMLVAWGDGQARDVHEDMMALTLGIVAKTLFGADLEGESKVVGKSMEIVMNYFMSPMRWFGLRERLPIPSTLRYHRAIKRIDDIIYGFIQRRRESLHNPGDLLGHLLAARDDQGKEGMTDRQLRDESVTLLLAGHETTALALTYAFYLLAQSPEADSRLSAELDHVLGGRPPRAADVPNLKYTEWVIRETMRLYPPAWGIGRQAVADCEIGGYSCPKGTQLFLVIWLVHRDGRWFPEPESFRPERWDHDLIKRLPRCAYFPFGDGARVCIGNHFAMMEAVLLLATIAQKYRLSLELNQLLELVPSITLRPRHGLHMRLVGRHHKESTATGSTLASRALVES